MDSARNRTDKQLEKMEERITEIYQKSAHDISKKWDAYMERAAKRIEAHEKDLRDAQKVGDDKIIAEMEKRLQNAKMNVTLRDSHYRGMLDAVTEQLAKVNETALEYINGEMPKVYAWNYNQAAETAGSVGVKFNLINEQTVKQMILNGEDHMDTLRKKLDKPKDKRWNAKQITSALTQGIIQGESIPKISRKIFHSLEGNGPKDITRKNRAAAVRNARTMVTGAENRGRNDSYKQLEEDGFVLVKVWMATPDGRTRDWHIDMDGVEVGINESFQTIYSDLEYPGDPSGDPADVYNCRCSMVTDVKGFRNADGSIREIAVHDADTEHEEAIAAEQAKRGIAEKYISSSIGQLTRPERPRKMNYDSVEEYEKAKAQYKEQKEEYNNELQRALTASMSNVAFSSASEVKQWATQNGILIDDEVLERIDLRAFNDTKPALEEMFKRYPEVKSYSLEYFDGSIITSGFKIGLTEDGLLSANGGFNFNPSYFSDASYGVQEGFEGIIDGTLVRGDGSFRTLVRHEFGHNVQHYIENKLADKYHYNVDDWRKNFSTFNEYESSRKAYFKERDQYKQELYSLAGLNGSSEYSNTNDYELFAEGFAEYSSGGTTEFGKKFGEFLERWY